MVPASIFKKITKIFEAEDNENLSISFDSVKTIEE